MHTCSGPISQVPVQPRLPEPANSSSESQSNSYKLEETRCKTVAASIHPAWNLFESRPTSVSLDRNVHSLANIGTSRNRGDLEYEPHTTQLHKSKDKDYIQLKPFPKPGPEYESWLRSAEASIYNASADPSYSRKWITAVNKVETIFKDLADYDPNRHLGGLVYIAVSRHVTICCDKPLTKLVEISVSSTRH